jgi:hypothetical protein
MKYSTFQARKKRIKSLILAGYSEAQIMKMTSFPPSQIAEFWRSLHEDMEWENKHMVDPVYFGSKNEAYYPPEDYPEEDLVEMNFDYTYNDLSEDEKVLYHLDLELNIKWDQMIHSLKN